ncbi:CatB-related O-acetyltransferase [Gluconobacter kondonii]|uniref:CatB-related O-acetyltransferase n=1 Tax=Gluconobacter kondonii TaxID=941463 RepID=UPI001B8CD115|nr:CatB-related O-acetyltransferase [Gluconobacter kondonii]MBS1079055.1 CatB-related O-acetyltransferase [Gluconobacter kondonii]
MDRHQNHPRRTDSYIFSNQGGNETWSKIGRHTYGFPEIQERGAAKLTIGNYCSIADEVVIILANHNQNYITQYPFFSLNFLWDKAKNCETDHVCKDVYIGNDVWIGYGVKILPGTIIGDGVIIAAGAVVCGTVSPYSIYGGVPAKLIRKRYDKDRIEKLLKIKWWEWEDEMVNNNINYLLSDDIDVFINKFYKDINKIEE